MHSSTKFPIMFFHFMYILLAVDVFFGDISKEVMFLKNATYFQIFPGLLSCVSSILKLLEFRAVPVIALRVT